LKIIIFKDLNHNKKKNDRIIGKKEANPERIHYKMGTDILICPFRTGLLLILTQHAVLGYQNLSFQDKDKLRNIKVGSFKK